MNKRISRPAAVLAIVAVCSLASARSSAQTSDGHAYIWGANSAGQLGVGGVAPSSSPVPVMLPAGAVDVQGGDDFTVALTSSGEVWTWGGNGAGQLGVGAVAPQFAPQLVGLPNGSRVAAIAVGARHVVVVSDDGRVFGWGGNWHGQLGDGTTENRSTPVEISVPGGAAAVSAGNDVSLALNPNGVLYAWGQDNAGQLGFGMLDRLVPTAVGVPGSESVIDADAGVHQTVAVTVSGGLLAWGRDLLGRELPAPISLDPSLGAVVDVAVGDNHVAALTDQGIVVSFGDDSHGQLGDGDHIDPDRIVAPTPVSLPGATGPVVALSAGGNHTLALTSTGQVFAWGGNGFGEIGVGSREDVTTPVLLDSLAGAAVTAVYAGRFVSGVAVTAGVPASLVVTPAVATVAPGVPVRYDVAVRDEFGTILGPATGAELTVAGGACDGWACRSDPVGSHPFVPCSGRCVAQPA